MTRNPLHPADCHCGLCTRRSPADPNLAIRARLIVAAIMAAIVLLVALISHWRTS
jgi:hypothetical protein